MPLLTTEELAHELKQTEATVRDWVKHGLVPSYRLPGGLLRFDLDAILRHLAKGVSNGGEEKQEGLDRNRHSLAGGAAKTNQVSRADDSRSAEVRETAAQASQRRRTGRASPKAG